MAVGKPEYSMDSWGIRYVKKKVSFDAQGRATSPKIEATQRDQTRANVRSGVRALDNPKETKPQYPRTPEGKKELSRVVGGKTRADKVPSKSPTKDIDNAKNLPKQGFETGNVTDRIKIPSKSEGTSYGKGRTQAQQAGSPNVSADVNTGGFKSPTRVDAKNQLQSAPKKDGVQYHPRGGKTKNPSGRISHGQAGSEKNPQTLPTSGSSSGGRQAVNRALELIIMKCKLLNLSKYQRGGSKYFNSPSADTGSGDKRQFHKPESAEDKVKKPASGSTTPSANVTADTTTSAADAATGTQFVFGGRGSGQGDDVTQKRQRGDKKLHASGKIKAWQLWLEQKGFGGTERARGSGTLGEKINPKARAGKKNPTDVGTYKQGEKYSKGEGNIKHQVDPKFQSIQEKQGVTVGTNADTGKEAGDKWIKSFRKWTKENKKSLDSAIGKCKLLKTTISKVDDLTNTSNVTGHRAGRDYTQGGNTHESFAGDPSPKHNIPTPKIEGKHTKDTKYYSQRGDFLGRGSKARKLMEDDIKGTKAKE